jgi:phage FluMu protein gp41
MKVTIKSFSTSPIFDEDMNDTGSTYIAAMIGTDNTPDIYTRQVFSREFLRRSFPEVGDVIGAKMYRELKKLLADTWEEVEEKEALKADLQNGARSMLAYAREGKTYMTDN